MKQQEVCVTLPMEFESASMAAGYMERLVATALENAGHGDLPGPVVSWVDDLDGRLMAFQDGQGAWEIQIPGPEYPEDAAQSN
jgi:hypothetical protein